MLQVGKHVFTRPGLSFGFVQRLEANSVRVCVRLSLNTQGHLQLLGIVHAAQVRIT